MTETSASLIREVTVVLSGDPKRKDLCERIAGVYRRFPRVKEVILLYERNPAAAFNKGARMASSDVIFFAGGDVLVRYHDFLRVVDKVREDDVLFFASPPGVLDRRRRILFCSAAFAAKRETIMKHPIPEFPDFLEEILWMQDKKLKFKPYFATIYHVHIHTFSHIFRNALLRYRLRATIRRRSYLLLLLGFARIFLDSLIIYVKERISKLETVYTPARP
ncbi:glycosyltransferase family 2 protein [Candidatus Methanodesulfokora washburnensis]|jgi:glycosyltransferase involved in cell wall biosynthesis|uniref:Glycosyltransferase family 2 protein n=1 Tax=Candidatus Methanodesulfokora washburnensis TaxID=2478471 RepID=A0A429GXZ8_9CREN|nr:glycosyltransferase family A protein [Candidatus Methanodesulfokores washburnensis]RSN78634.1 glycosyltransferase family 2 protein [Candidatus Methanodesulfokores washburnensis]